MKRVLALLLALLVFLCACDQKPAPTEQTTVPTTLPPEPTEPEPVIRPDFGLYRPDSPVELQSNGAVKFFDLDGTEAYAVELWNDGLLVFSGLNETTLTLYREEKEPLALTLDCFIHPYDASLRLCEDGIHYYSLSDRMVVTLSPDFQDITHVPLPEDMRSIPALSSDGKTAYYYSQDALRCVDLTTGTSRLLRVSSYMNQEIWGVHFDDTLLECWVFDGDVGRCCYISAQSGEVITELQSVPVLSTIGQRYFAQYFEKGITQGLFASRGEKPQCLQPKDTLASFEPVIEMNGCVTVDVDENGTSLSYYDLEQGTCSAALRLDGVGSPGDITADAENSCIWVLATNLAGTEQGLYYWEPELSPTEDQTNYVTPYYTVDEPDTAGLKQIADRAKALGDRYGLRIWTWQDALKVTPGDYVYETEYRVDVYERYLPLLESALGAYPDGFFKKLGKSSDNGVVTISLVGGLMGDNELGSLTSADGIHFWNDGSSYIALCMNELTEQTFYHELFHAMDSYILSHSVAIDKWTELNPEGFEYDYSYINNQFREDYQYLEDGTRSFIDMYSMSFPNEDRARVMEYAMMPDNEAYFNSDTMQAKLKMLCAGIRDAFGLKKYTNPLRWEQYLK